MYVFYERMSENLKIFKFCNSQKTAVKNCTVQHCKVVLYFIYDPGGSHVHK